MKPISAANNTWQPSTGRALARRCAPVPNATTLLARRSSREPRAESREPRAESREPRAESREPRAERQRSRLLRFPILDSQPFTASHQTAHRPHTPAHRPPTAD
ncbi:hypothetical protein IXO645_000140 [Xanthomonas oryzae pv. oryzae]|nr:hypothetical protein IXO645_000140 [Xanthomonas oryzae pv. oryzae]